ncbi:Glutamyl-tRNA synthetase @ Glutamyl-tRNA(Gln) synthetase [hydrothermal vent metagenome]|uniref:glutamate--tRNA ligase n=1 Tax=hydrothermal vent metagenome TaxID=652676 RepID=A0A3B0V4R0_9ZZZZ
MIRVRFAPSPTGGLHIGGVRTALYNYLFAKKYGGKFILRIEDTDQKRKVEGAEEYIMKALEWCGIAPDESPTNGGNFEPYRQSERLDLYKQYAQQLLDAGLAYYAFDKPEELEAMRAKLQEAKAANQQYSSINRMEMRNSLTLDKSETVSLINSGAPYVVRIKLEGDKTVEVQDVIRGKVVVNTNTMDDKILMKSDGFPTYHLANIVDDHLMKITHVIRGEEWLPSAPLHVLLYQYLGWEVPKFAHLPLLLKPDGNGKLSKRDADKHGFPIFPLNYTDAKTGDMTEGFKEKGYLPETMVNFLALLGWNPGTEQEIFSLEELTEAFELERISKAGAKFDIQKANWLNEHYLRSTPKNKLADYLINKAQEAGFNCSTEKAIAIVNLLIERSTFEQDLWNNGQYFFVSPTEYDAKTVKKKWKNETVLALKLFITKIKDLENPTPEAFKEQFEKTVNELELGFGKVMPGLRLALTGQGGGPDLMGILAVLGVKESIKRIGTAIKTIEI